MERLAALEQHRDHRTHWALPVCLTAIITATLGYMAWLGVTLNSQSLTLTRIDQTLGFIQQSLPARNVIGTAANLTPRVLSAELSAVHATLKRENPSTAKMPDSDLAKIQTNLLSINPASAPSYWPLVFDLISYRSIAAAGLPAPPVGRLELYNVRLPGQLFRNKNVRLGGLIEGVVFIDSWVAFDSKIPVVLKDVRFERCVLVFLGFDTQSPSPEIKKFGHDLIASAVDIKDFHITSGG